MTLSRGFLRGPRGFDRQPADTRRRSVLEGMGGFSRHEAVGIMPGSSHNGSYLTESIELRVKSRLPSSLDGSRVLVEHKYSAFLP